MEKDEILNEAQLALYKQALITIAWCIPSASKGQNARRRLVFASVELIPKYWGEEYGNKEDSVQTRNPNCRYYYRRWETCVNDALEWYKSIHQNHVLYLPNETEKKVYLFPEGVENALVETPAYPYLATSIDSPIVPSNWGAVRLSHLTPHNIDKDIILLDLMNDETIYEWFNSRLMFELNENIDYLSSVNLIVPNPYYCRSFLKLDSKSDSNKESVFFSLDNYPKNDSLQLICCESINDEISNLKTYPINQNPINIPLLKTGDKFGYAVFTRNNDLIDYSGFNSFVRKICFNIRMTGIQVAYKNANNKEISVEKNQKEESIITGEQESPEIVLSHKKAMIKHSREERRTAENQLFFCQEDEAAVFVRKLINSAQKSLFIIDPYFNEIQVVDYLLSVSNRHIKIKVLTSSEAFTKEHLETDIIEMRTKFKNRGLIDELEIDIMTGRPLFHDRFLIIDEKDVWLSGNSLHNIGSRFSSLIKLYNSQEIIKTLNSFVNDHPDRIQTIEKWIQNKRDCSNGINK